MDLVNIRENALTVELDWADCTLLAHLIKRALESDALHDAAAWSMADGYARTVLALLEAGGMATWAHTTTEEDFTLEHFRTVAPVTVEDRARLDARCSSRRGQQADDTVPGA
ncbi:MAG: hypothetical protein M3Q65_23265 [Chloroflexota bacterium]|nr:hypothetical protein [Chloroflexota bacterium]